MAGTVFSRSPGPPRAAFSPHTLPESLIAERASPPSEPIAQRSGLPGHDAGGIEEARSLLRRHGFAPIEGQPCRESTPTPPPVRDYTGQLLQCVVTMIRRRRHARHGVGGERAKAMLAFAGKLSSDLGYRAP